MSAPLAPCPSCGRHARTTEATCPFCAAAMPASFAGSAKARAASLSAPSPAVSRQSLYALGAARAKGLAAAALATATLGACSTAAPAYGVPVDLGTGSDSGTAQDSGAPDSGARDAGATDAGATDAGTTDSGATTDARAQDAGVDLGSHMTLYGLPPAG